jgi:hypothetical protein
MKRNPSTAANWPRQSEFPNSGTSAQIESPAPLPPTAPCRSLLVGTRSSNPYTAPPGCRLLGSTPARLPPQPRSSPHSPCELTKVSLLRRPSGSSSHQATFRTPSLVPIVKTSIHLYQLTHMLFPLSSLAMHSLLPCLAPQPCR